MRLLLALVLGMGLTAASRAEACVPGCSGYHLSFTGPLGAGAIADQSVAVTWQDTLDGPQATFDLMASADPVPAYPMHSFPAQLPGQLLALALPATGQSSWSWNTAGVKPGTYFLYAVFHNSPFNTLVMPFAAISVVHGGAAAQPAALIQNPRGTTAVSGAVQVDLDAVVPSSGAVVDVYVGSPPEAADGVPVAMALPATPGQSLQWDSSQAAAGSYVFKAVVRDSTGVLATALSPGTVEVGPVAAPAGASCETGTGTPVAALGVALGGLWSRRRRRSAPPRAIPVR